MAYSPYMDCVTVGVSAVQLSALITAIDKNAPSRCAKIEIQYNTGATGVLLIGNSNVAATHCGKNVAAGSIATFDGTNTGLLLTSDFWMIAGAAAQQVNVTLYGIGM